MTDADEEAEKLILAELAAAFPGVPVVAEEEAAAGRIAKWRSRFFLVDPVDGTKEFVKRGGEFTVNIGEIVDGKPVAGVVLAPAIGRLFVGEAGEGAFEITDGIARAIGCAHAARRRAGGGVQPLPSRSPRPTNCSRRCRSKGHTNAGSSLKFCLVAAGEADIYPRAGHDHGMGHRRRPCRAGAAGGRMTTWDGTPFLYGKPDFRNGPFIARGK